jgi:hypothetical protein
VPNDLWGPLLNSCETFNLPIGTVTKDGQEYQVLAFGTFYGDGCYTDQSGHSFPVDAGLIGLTPVGLADGHSTEIFGSTLVEFKVDTECSCRNGVLKFGTHTIDTKDSKYYGGLIMNETILLLDKISPKWKALAFEHFVTDWNREEANAATAFDNLLECTGEKLEEVVDALGIVWWSPFDRTSDRDITDAMYCLAESMQACEGKRS